MSKSLFRRLDKVNQFLASLDDDEEYTIYFPSLEKLYTFTGRRYHEMFDSVAAGEACEDAQNLLQHFKDGHIDEGGIVYLLDMYSPETVAAVWEGYVE